MLNSWFRWFRTTLCSNLPQHSGLIPVCLLPWLQAAGRSAFLCVWVYTPTIQTIHTLVLHTSCFPHYQHFNISDRHIIMDGTLSPGNTSLEMHLHVRVRDPRRTLRSKCLSDAQVLVFPFLIFKLDYCTLLLASLPLWTIWPVKLIQNDFILSSPQTDQHLLTSKLLPNCTTLPLTTSTAPPSLRVQRRTVSRLFSVLVPS